jgi:hypothetical protein
MQIKESYLFICPIKKGRQRTGHLGDKQREIDRRKDRRQH